MTDTGNLFVCHVWAGGHSSSLSQLMAIGQRSAKREIQTDRSPPCPPPPTPGSHLITVSALVKKYQIIRLYTI